MWQRDGRATLGARAVSAQLLVHHEAVGLTYQCRCEHYAAMNKVVNSNPARRLVWQSPNAPQRQPLVWPLSSLLASQGMATLVDSAAQIILAPCPSLSWPHTISARCRPELATGS